MKFLVIMAFLAINLHSKAINVGETNHHNLKSFSILKPNAFENLGKYQESIFFKRISFSVTSSTYTIDGCTFYITATVSFDWNPTTQQATNATISDYVVHQNCPTLIGYARNIEDPKLSTTTNGLLDDIYYQITGDTKIDKFLNDGNLKIELINKINYELQNRRD